VTSIGTPQPDPDFDFARILRAGDIVAWPQGTGEPLALTRRLVAERHALPPVGLFLGMSTSTTLAPAHADRFAFRALNGAGTNRRLAAAGLLDIVPAHVSSVPGLLRSGAVHVDIVLLRVRPHPDHPGHVTTGVICDFTQALIAAARCVVGELDEHLPLTGQDALLPVSAIHHFVAATTAPMELPDPDPTPLDRRIAEIVAGFIPDRATIQLGIGSLPVAVCRALSGHRELGLHSGVVSDALVPLVEAGVITNAHKGIDAGLSVTGALFGSRVLFDFASGNPALAMRSADYTHNIVTLAGISRLFSVNSALEVDVTGQVNAELAGGRYLGAVGGQADFVRGAIASPGGRSIIALPATTPDGTRSRIVLSLEGRPVTTARGDVDAVITEFGIAELRGCSFSERARRLAAIAHPDFRADLLRGHMDPSMMKLPA
jgi:acyl-CoA hydrolase